MRKLTIIGVTLGITGVAVLAGVDAICTSKPEAGHGESESCGACHEGSAQQSHTARFREEIHGVAAQADREGCMSCHDESTSCDECHQEESPAWHTELFLDKNRDGAWREEHITVGIAHRNACLECHALRFHTQCADCHLSTEWSQ